MGDITFFHSPQSRSSGVKVLLEELGAPYTLKILNMRAGEHLGAAFLAVNPIGKVPAILDGEALVSEQVAVFLHLADRFPAAGLAPAIDDPLRGPYLRWMVYYASAFEPAVVDRAMQREPGARAMSPYGSYDLVMRTIVEQLRSGPYLSGYALFGGRHPVGHGVELDRDVRHGAEGTRDHALHRSLRGSSERQEGRSRGCGTRGGAPSRGGCRQAQGSRGLTSALPKSCLRLSSCPMKRSGGNV